jgi:endonuclease-3
VGGSVLGENQQDSQKTELIKEVSKRLKEARGRRDRLHGANEPSDGNGLLLQHVRESPLDILVATVLSQATTDKTSLKAYERLKARFQDMNLLDKADQGEIEHLIGICGLAKQKANSLKGIISTLKCNGDYIDPGLSFLEDLGPDKAFQYLCGIKGIGPKTAACVLLFGFGWPVFPVDTHIHRILKRTGLIGERTSPKKAQAIMNAVTPPDLVMDLHLDLIHHGRSICTSRQPKCEKCVIRDVCLTGESKSPGGYCSPGSPVSGVTFSGIPALPV